MEESVNTFASPGISRLPRELNSYARPQPSIVVLKRWERGEDTVAACTIHKLVARSLYLSVVV